jgi:enediyne biosynthesis protein E4
VTRTTLALLFVLSAFPAGAAEPAFEDVTADWGIEFSHQSAPEKKFILESMSGGVALFDFDGDGLLDVYLVNSLTVDTADEPRSAPSALYRNLGREVGPNPGGIRFEDVSERAGVAYPGWGVGVCVGDADGGGLPDLYVTGVEGNRLYLNRGDGTFEDATEAWGAAGGGWSTGCGFADYDRDGDLDLFVSRYVKMDLADLPELGSQRTCQYRGIAVQCGPRGLPGTPDLLFRNESTQGRGGFTEVSKAAGVDDPDGYFGLGIAWMDVDGDGWLDLYVGNDSNPNFLYRNRGDGTFEETAFPSGVAVSEDGAEQGAMGIAVGDFRNLGRFAIFVSNFAEEYNAFYQNEGSYFSDVSFRTKTAPVSLPYVGWGTSFFDYDNDGWLDLVVVNGHVYPQLATADLSASASYRQRKLLYRNRGDGTFEEVTGQVPAFLEERVSRGLAAGDLDRDGRLDLVVNDLDRDAQVFRNETGGTEASTGEGGGWLVVELHGPESNRDGVGAVVRVRARVRSEETVMSRLVRSGTSYLSQDEMRQHFGLGGGLGDASVEAVEVDWPDGKRTVVKGVPAGNVVRIYHPAD